jgi:hypothetical protein
MDDQVTATPEREVFALSTARVTRPGPRFDGPGRARYGERRVGETDWEALHHKTADRSTGRMRRSNDTHQRLTWSMSC